MMSAAVVNRSRSFDWSKSRQVLAILSVFCQARDSYGKLVKVGFLRQVKSVPLLLHEGNLLYVEFELHNGGMLDSLKSWSYGPRFACIQLFQEVQVAQQQINSDITEATYFSRRNNAWLAGYITWSRGTPERENEVILLASRVASYLIASF